MPALPDGPSAPGCAQLHRDRKSTRLNSSHLGISYAVFCLKKKIKLVVKFLLARVAMQRSHTPTAITNLVSLRRVQLTGVFSSIVNPWIRHSLHEALTLIPA